MSTTAVQPKSTRWLVDPNESSVEFAVKTFWGLMTVNGAFDRFSGSYDVGADGETIELTIDADSLDTGHTKRDEHLRSDDFFDVDKHPQVRFTSTRVHHVSDDILHVVGWLEAGGKSTTLEFPASLTRVGGAIVLEARASLDQRELGMSSGMFGMIRPPAILRVKAVLTA